MIHRDAAHEASLVWTWSGGAVAPSTPILIDAVDTAVLCQSGRVLGALGPGQYFLHPSLRLLATAGAPPWELRVLFVRTLPCAGARFGGPKRLFLDRASGLPARTSIRGTFGFRVVDPILFVQAAVLGESAASDDATTMDDRYVGPGLYAIAFDVVSAALLEGRSLLALSMAPAELLPAIHSRCTGEWPRCGLELLGIERLVLEIDEDDRDLLGALTPSAPPGAR